MNKLAYHLWSLSRDENLLGDRILRLPSVSWACLSLGWDRHGAEHPGVQGANVALCRWSDASAQALTFAFLPSKVPGRTF